MNWKESMPFLSPQYTEHAVNGENLKFYPVSVGLLFKLRTLAKPVACAISSLFSSTKNDVGSASRTITHPDQTTDNEIIVEPIDIKIAEFREDRKDRAIGDLVTAITCEETLKTLAEIVKDSMRDTFPKGDPNTPPTGELLAIPTPVFIEMVCGAIKANQGLLRPLLGMFPKLPETILKRVNDQLNVNSNRPN